MATTETEIGRFEAEDEDGKVYTVFEYQIIIRSDEVKRDGMSAHGRVLRKFKLKTGQSVNKVDSETFEIAHNNKVIRKL